MSKPYFDSYKIAKTLNTCSLFSLVADRVIFNSHYNMNSFLKSIPTFLSIVPDYRPKRLSERIAHKCSVLYFPVELIPARSEGTLCDATEKQETRVAVPVLTDHSSKHSSGARRNKCNEVPMSMHTATPALTSDKILHILWPHRW